MNAIHELRAAGVSIWLDDLSRDDIVSGRLADLVDAHGVTGITTNPTIFANSLEKHPEAYADQLASLGARGVSAREAAVALVTDDVRAACDILRPVHESTGGADGFVSIEVTPDTAHDVEATLAEVRELSGLVDRRNLFVKIPSTDAGILALEEATADGFNVNMTLLFGIPRYRQVIAAYQRGLERARAAGFTLAGIHSVASFFVSRVDVEVDTRLDALGTPDAHALRGRAAVANARLAYAEFAAYHEGPVWRALAQAGANPQRPLWASTGVKDPTMRDTRYIDDLAAPLVVDTMPAKTLEAVEDHGRIVRDSISAGMADAREVADALARAGVELDDVSARLEEKAIASFGDSWARLLAAVAH